jgi:hypothetical protein
MIHSLSYPGKNRSLSLLTAAAVSSLLWVCKSRAVEFNAIGFEGQTISNIPYATNVGIPNGTPVNTPFSYLFADGNNLQYFNNPSAGITDTDDASSGSNSIPDYYKASGFGWRLTGWQATNNISADYTLFNNSYVGNGAGLGADYSGGIAGRQTELSEAININRKFSPANGNLPSAPGLGDQFLDTHGSTGNTSLISLQFTATQNDSWFMTLAFGGRDGGSGNFRGYYRLLDGTTPVFTGNTSDLPFEAYTPLNPADTTLGSVPASLTTSMGVAQKDWEYFKQSFSVTAGSLYTLQVLLPEEQNFDFALGSNYTSTPGLVVVPEPSAAVLGMLGLAGLMRRRRRA